MERYSHHQPHFVLLRKNETEKDRNIALKFGDVQTTRNYAEILNISEHFGNYRSLSIKGCSAQFYPNTNNMEVKKKKSTSTHTYMIDRRKTHQQHMRANVSFGSVFDGGGMYLLKEVPYPIKNGFAKQYWCVNTLHLISIFCANDIFCIDWVIGASGHGKYLVDRLNACDK